MKRIIIGTISIVLGGLILLAIIGALSDRDPRNGVPVQEVNPATVEVRKSTLTRIATANACLGSDKFKLAAPDTITMTRKGYMIVDFYTIGEPQYVTVLPFEEGTVYDLEGSVLGAYWIYPQTCTFDELVVEAIAHAEALKNDGYNIVGYVNWQESGVFSLRK